MVDYVRGQRSIYGQHDRFIDEDGDQWSSYLCLSSVTASWVE